MSEFKIFSKHYKVDDASLREDIFLQFVNDFNLVEFLNKILSSNMLTCNIANKSYSHVNGFDKIVLFENEYYKLRLHLWNKRTDFYQGDLHNHRWNFCSKILLGSYKYENYEITDSNKSFEYYEYEYLPRINDEQFSLHFVKKIKLALKESGTKSSGDIQSLDYLTPHRITNLSDITATLFLSYRSLKATTSVFLENSFENKIVTYKKMDERVFTKLIKQFLDIS